MNKKGFTLTELLAVIVIIGIISLIAIPNVVNISDNVKNDNMLADAKKFISLAKAEVLSDYSIREMNEKIFYIMDLNKNGDFRMEIVNGSKKIIDIDGGHYDENNSSDSSYVKYINNNDTPKYCIYLNGSKRTIGSFTSCVNEEMLVSKDIIHVK